MKIFRKESGQAIVLVISMLGVVSIISLSYLYMTQVQLRGINTYLARLQCRYLAEAGINHVREILMFDKQANILDTYDELWRTAFEGSDVDLDSDGMPDAKWFYVEDNEGIDVGRYAVLVEDESGKININADEAILKGFFGGGSAVSDILDYRYGEDKKPGIANTDDNGNNAALEKDLLDNDGDGLVDEINEGIDEPQEFNIEEPIGDDRPFVVIDELKKFSSIDFENIERLVTVSSQDLELDGQGFMRQNLNYIKAENLMKIMVDKGVTHPWQKAVNITDSLDRNFSRETVFKHYNLLEPTPGQPTGSWVWNGSYYQCAIPSSIGSWSWQNLPFPDGEYHCYIYGLGDKPIGDVTIDGVVQESMYSGDAFIQSENRKITVAGGSFSLSIQNNEQFGTTCYFDFIELVPDDENEGSALLSKRVHGVEAIRINEIMVAPKSEKNVNSSMVPGGAWAWQGNYFVNADSDSGEIGEGTWVFNGIPNGYYYVRLFGKEGEFIGDVEINRRTQASLRDGDYFTAIQTVQVISSQLVIRIQNNFSDRTCYFKGIVLSQQPDTEYVELINICEDTVDLSGWALETTGQEAAVAYISQGTTIPSYGYLVLCVDRDDTSQGIASNNISFVDTWAKQNAVQLDFFKVLDKDFDFLKDVPIEGENFLILRDVNGSIVDVIEYLYSQVVNYSSLERGDPGQQGDSNGNSEFDVFFLTSGLSGGTPGDTNDNAGMRIDEFHDHDVREVVVRNRPATNISDLLYAPKVYSWQMPRYLISRRQNMNLSDISLIVDSLTLSGLALSPGDNNVAGWTQIQGEIEGFYSSNKEEEGVWQWQNLANGHYFLTISGEFNEAFTVSYRKADNSWQVLAQNIIPDEEGLASCGIVSIGQDYPNGTLDNVLEIKLRNVSDTNISHFYYLRLDPLRNVYGRVNINTAPQEVLTTLPNMSGGAASSIINNRPLGNMDGIYKGIGDLFLIDIFGDYEEKIRSIGSLSNYITVRSNVFKIIARAQVLDRDRVVATQEIKTIIERD